MSKPNESGLLNWSFSWNLHEANRFMSSSSQTAALPRPQEEEETDKSKQAQDLQPDRPGYEPMDMSYSP